MPALTRSLMVSGVDVAGPNVQTIFARRTIFPNQRFFLSLLLGTEQTCANQEAIALVLLDDRVALVHLSELTVNCWFVKRKLRHPLLKPERPALDLR